MSTVNESNPSPNVVVSNRVLWFELIFLGLLLVIDQMTKLWAQQHDQVVLNNGGVFGVLPSGFWIVGLTAVWLVLMWQWWHHKPGLGRFGMGLIVMGGLGNLIDRFLFGSVRDFIFYPWFGFYGNLADVYLALGVAAVIFANFKSGKITQ